MLLEDVTFLALIHDILKTLYLIFELFRVTIVTRASVSERMSGQLDDKRV
jgi:hypothetical protein